MRKRKIQYQIMIADSFTYSKPNGIDNTHLWPIAVGNWEEHTPIIEFEQIGNDAMIEADEALRKWVKETYPNKEYKIYYWYWLD